jgi:prepilin-type N-terminal cleavage/methylation domain-containing protein
MLRSRQALCTRRTSAGFTLVELMTVVAITGILAAIGVALVTGHVNAAKAGRALVGVAAVRVAEEQYRSQNGQYLGCSSDSDPKWYPMETPSKVEYNWRQTGHPDWACWRVLGVAGTSSSQAGTSATQYGYLVNAGRPGDAYPPLLTTDDPVLPTPARDLWYVIQVRGNVDGDTTFMQAVSSSYADKTYIENEVE